MMKLGGLMLVALAISCVPALAQTVGPVITVPNVAQLEAAPYEKQYSTVQLQGYYSAGDGGGGAVSYSAASAATVNGGSVLATASGIGRWLRSGPLSSSLVWGATGSDVTTTATTNAGSTSVALASAGDFLNGEPISIRGPGASNTLSTPAAPTLTVEPAAGSNTRCYRVVFADTAEGYTAASPETCTSTAPVVSPATGSAFTQDVLVSWAFAGQPPAVVAIYQGASGAEICSFEQDATVPADLLSSPTSKRDFGQTGECPSWLPSAYPTAPQADWLRTSITSGGGTTTITTAAAPSSTVAGALVEHDDTTPLQTQAASVYDVSLACGSYHIKGSIVVQLGDGASLSSAKGLCAKLKPAGAGYNALSSTGSGQGLYDLNLSAVIDASDMGSGYALYLNNINDPKVHLEVFKPYNNVYETNIVKGVQYIDSNLVRRGDRGTYLYASTIQTQVGITLFDWINEANSFQARSLELNGCIGSLRMRHFAAQKAQNPNILVDNLANCSNPGPLYVHADEGSTNFAWSGIPLVTSITGGVSYNVSGSRYNGSLELTVGSSAQFSAVGGNAIVNGTGVSGLDGTTNFPIVIDANHILLPTVPFTTAPTTGQVSSYAPAVSLLVGTDFEAVKGYWQYLGPANSGDEIYIGAGYGTTFLSLGSVFGAGWNGITAGGYANFVDDVIVFNNTNASVEATPSSGHLDLRGGDLNYTYISRMPKTGQNYGALLDAGAQNSYVCGPWIGQVVGTYNRTASTDGTVICDVPVGSPDNIVSTTPGNRTLLTTTFPGLYTATAGRAQVFDISGFTAPVTYTTDSAANIIASLPAEQQQVGTIFRIRIVNHQNQPVTLGAGTGVTLAGTTVVPASGVIYSQIAFPVTGTITGIGGSAAVTIRGGL